MAFTAVTPIISYAGDDLQVLFTFAFPVAALTDVVVTLVDANGIETVQVSGTDYSIASDDLDAGGTVTMNTAPATGETLVISRDTDLSQLIDYRENDPFPAETHEAGLDKAMMAAADVARDMGNAIRFPSYENPSTNVLPAEAERASRYLAFDASGDIIATTGPISGIPVSPLGESLVGQSTAEQMKTVLEVNESSKFQVTAGENIAAGDPVGYYAGEYVVHKAEVLGYLGDTVNNYEHMRTVPGYDNMALVVSSGGQARTVEVTPSTGALAFNGSWTSLGLNAIPHDVQFITDTVFIAIGADATSDLEYTVWSVAANGTISQEVAATTLVSSITLADSIIIPIDSTTGTFAIIYHDSAIYRYHIRIDYWTGAAISNLVTATTISTLLAADTVPFRGMDGGVFSYDGTSTYRFWVAYAFNDSTNTYDALYFTHYSYDDTGPTLTEQVGFPLQLGLASDGEEAYVLPRPQRDRYRMQPRQLVSYRDLDVQGGYPTVRILNKVYEVNDHGDKILAGRELWYHSMVGVTQNPAFLPIFDESNAYIVAAWTRGQQDAMTSIIVMRADTYQELFFEATDVPADPYDAYRSSGWPLQVGGGVGPWILGCRTTSGADVGAMVSVKIPMFVGIATESVAAGNPVTVARHWNVTGLSGLSVGPYCTNMKEGTIEPGLSGERVGFAISATELIVEI